jgi:peptidylprolyl isomerase
MSKRVKDRPRAMAPDGTPMLPKAERRELGRQAAAKRAAARRRRRMMQKLLPYAAAIGVVGVIVAAFAIFNSGGGGNPSASATTAAATEPATPAAATPTQIPADVDRALATKPVVTKGEGTVTKLTTKTLIEGKGAVVQIGQTLTVNYVGVTYTDGVEFDSSWKSGKFFSFVFGTGGVIKGWDQGLTGAKVGSRVQLDIPADLAYGDHPTGGQPGGALRFVVDILGATTPPNGTNAGDQTPVLP